MVSSSTLAEDCVADVVDKIKAIPGLSSKVFHVFSEEDIDDKTKNLIFPCVGVVYDGIRDAGSSVGSSDKQGVSGVLTVSIIYLFRKVTNSSVDVKDEAVRTLDLARKALRGSAPGGHKWRFLLESPLGSKTGILAYVQRWSTPVQLL